MPLICLQPSSNAMRVGGWVGRANCLHERNESRCTSFIVYAAKVVYAKEAVVVKSNDCGNLSY